MFDLKQSPFDLELFVQLSPGVHHLLLKKHPFEGNHSEANNTVYKELKQNSRYCVLWFF